MLNHLLGNSHLYRGDEFEDELFTLLFAGYDTTSLSLAFALYLIATNPEVEERLMSELDRVLQGEPPSYQTYPELQYTSCIIKESLRLYPPAPLTSRSLESDLELEPGITLPAGLEVWVPITTMQRLDHNWLDAEAVRPERFLGPDNKSAAWFPFSGGPRSCAGQKFAMLEAVLALATLCQRLRFELAPGYKLECEFAGVIQRPRNGLQMRIYSRQQE